MAHRPDYESADYKEGYEDGKREASKEWVGLSDEEIEEAVNYLNVKIDYPIMFARLIEMHLKEKNG